MNFRATQTIFGLCIGLLVILQANTAYAFFGLFGSDSFGISQIAENIVRSSENLPGLLTGLAYAVGLLLGTLGITDLKAHVENAPNTPLRNGLIKLLSGGALFALPAVYSAMENAINPGDVEFGTGGGISNLLSTVSGMFSSFFPTADINHVLATIIQSLENLPGIISAFAYLLGLLLGYMGVVKIKEHVENPDQVKLHEGAVRLIVGGALFAIPTIYEAMKSALEGDGIGIFGSITNVVNMAQIYYSTETGDMGCSPIKIPFLGSILGGSKSLGNLACGIIQGTSSISSFLVSISYLFGTVLGVMGLMKVRDHVLNPSQIQIWEPIQRLVAGGAFFALPTIISAIRNTIVPEAGVIAGGLKTNTGFAGDSGGGLFDFSFGIGDIVGGLLGTGGGCMPGGQISNSSLGGFGKKINDFLGLGGDASKDVGGLDAALACFMNDLFGPMHVLLNFFGVVAGTILIMIGISRLLKTSQDGARGPGGLGTMMTFLVGGALLSFNTLIRSFSTSLFGNPITYTYAELKYAEGLTESEIASTHMVISSVLKFMILVGLISFVRGLFILRGVSEGDNQASMMSSVTHLIGGALAVNLGPMLNAVQVSLGITGFGITFGAG